MECQINNCLQNDEISQEHDNFDSIEKCQSCRGLFCRKHINDHDFCERAKRYRKSIKKKYDSNDPNREKFIKEYERICLKYGYYVCYFSEDGYYPSGVKLKELDEFFNLNLANLRDNKEE